MKIRPHYPPFAFEALREAERLLYELQKTKNKSKRAELKEQIEDNLDTAAFGGIRRSYIKVIRNKFIS